MPRAFSTASLFQWISLLIAAFFLNPIRASSYYFSSSAGNDSLTSLQAKNPQTPWRTLVKLNSFMMNLLPGDSVLFKRGDVFYGTVTITRSGTTTAPIVFSDYGSGAKPVISGLSALGGWSSKGSNLWEADCPSCGPVLNMVLVNDAPSAMGRYPNVTATDKGYLTFEANGPLQITDNELPAAPNWTGGVAVIKSTRYTLDRCPISSHVGTTLTYPPRSGSTTLGTSYALTNGFGYFIQNHPLTLDQVGEWVYNPGTKKILVYAGAGSPAASAIKVSTLRKLVSVMVQSGLTFNNISFEGANDTAMHIYGAKSVVIKNCDFNFSGTMGVSVGSSSNLSFEGNTVQNTHSLALSLSGSNSSVIRNNIISKTGLFPGMGRHINATGISVVGNGNLVEFNTVDSTGYNAINFQGDSVTVKNNLISHFAIWEDDGGGIYTWNSCPSSPSGGYYGFIRTQRKIIGNIILNGIGAPEGTDRHDYIPAEGIYMDDNTMNVEISGNTVAHCANHGIFVHNSHELMIRQNTVFNNNQAQFIMQQGGNCDGLFIRNDTVQDNIFFSKQPSQLLVQLESYAAGNDVGLFGIFDRNYYCRPLNENFVISTYHNATYNLTQWQSVYGKDPNSKTTAKQITPYTVKSIVGGNKYLNGTFNSDLSGLYGSPGTYAWDNTGKLDGGCERISFGSAGALTLAYNIIGIGSVDSGKVYRLKFSLRGTRNNQQIQAALRIAGLPYSNITPTENCVVTDGRTENEFLFKVASTQSSAAIQFYIPSVDSTLWLDNIQLHEVTATMTNPDDSIRFEYNATQSPRSFTLSGSYVDVKNNPYSGTVTLQPYTSIILLKTGTGTSADTGMNGDAPLQVTVRPNPFNPESRITVFLPRSNGVRLEVFDLSGRSIRILHQGVLNSGNHLFFWNGRDNRDALVGAGVYLYRLVAGNFLLISRAILVK